MSKYESPISVSMVDETVDQVRKEQETVIMQRVKMVVDVDKDELLRALAYDRGQYEKGYLDGYYAAKGEACDVLKKIADLAREHMEEDGDE